MNLDNEMNIYKEKKGFRPNEEQIRRTVEASIEQFLASEEERTLSYASFLYLQFSLIPKKWWVLQALILAALRVILPFQDPVLYGPRSMGVAASLFVILIIPEIWKNRNSGSMEIEGAAYYSLRQIYGARLLLFGIVDVSLLTMFSGAASVSLRMAFAEFLIQFLFPATVTACICFGVLCSKRQLNEAASIGMCVIWTGIWWFILLSETLYSVIMVPIWCLLLGIALLFLGFALRRSICCCNEIWEVNGYGIANE